MDDDPTSAELLKVLALLRAGHWNAAHECVQRHEGQLAAWLHGLAHLQEGDLENAEYWYGQAGQRFRERGTLEEELDRAESVLKGPREI